MFSYTLAMVELVHKGLRSLKVGPDLAKDAERHAPDHWTSFAASVAKAWNVALFRFGRVAVEEETATRSDRKALSVRDVVEHGACRVAVALECTLDAPNTFGVDVDGVSEVVV